MLSSPGTLILDSHGPHGHIVKPDTNTHKQMIR